MIPKHTSGPLFFWSPPTVGSFFSRLLAVVGNARGPSMCNFSEMADPTMEDMVGHVGREYQIYRVVKGGGGSKGRGFPNLP